MKIHHNVNQQRCAFLFLTSGRQQLLHFIFQYIYIYRQYDLKKFKCYLILKGLADEDCDVQLDLYC